MAGLKEFFQATVEDKLLASMPNDALQHATPATQLLEKRQELAEVEKALQTQKEDFKLRMDSLDQRRAELERKEFQLQESLLKFDRFLKENDARRERADRKATVEHQVADERQMQVDELQAQLASLKANRARNTTILERYSKFNDYMQSVLTVSGDYQEIPEVITRYNTLRATQADLKARDRKNQAKIDEIKTEMAQEKEKHRVHMLDCSNKVATLQAEKESARTDTLYWENQLAQVQGAATKRTLLLGQIKMATSNLHALIQKRSKVKSTDLDTLQQLDKIRHYILDLEDITQDYQRTLEPRSE
eukprot:TRINITY_DN9702_c0_g1_i2.p1 TRINITY_DN9702_c0_g1~~TRINITY_DN9702_c0_g1_i2.p1  ORF type:complete len:305 (+),score=69.64 TRINITY_DN9702_c0_g1_i2:282-1196(+)